MKWEYTIEQNETFVESEHDFLNRMGSDGWELVAVFDAVFGGFTRLNERDWVFKRRIEPLLEESK